MYYFFLFLCLAYLSEYSIFQVHPCHNKRQGFVLRLNSIPSTMHTMLAFFPVHWQTLKCAVAWPLWMQQHGNSATSWTAVFLALGWISSAEVAGQRSRLIFVSLWHLHTFTAAILTYAPTNKALEFPFPDSLTNPYPWGFSCNTPSASLWFWVSFPGRIVMLALFHMPSWPLCVSFGEIFIKLFEQLVCIASLTRF